jgi:hypothetical protein
MTKASVLAGISWRLIEARWPPANPARFKAFNRWHRESGRPMAQISQILAMSVD